MISLEKLKILAPLQKLPKNVGDLRKINVAQGSKKSPKVQKIGKSVTLPKSDCCQRTNVDVNIWTAS